MPLFRLLRLAPRAISHVLHLVLASPLLLGFLLTEIGRLVRGFVLAFRIGHFSRSYSPSVRREWRRSAALPVDLACGAVGLDLRREVFAPMAPLVGGVDDCHAKPADADNAEKSPNPSGGIAHDCPPRKARSPGRSRPRAPQQDALRPVPIGRLSRKRPKRALGSVAQAGGRPRPFVLVVALVFFARFRSLLRRLLTIFRGAAGARRAAELVPVRLREVDAVMLGRLLDVGEGELAVLVRHADGLVEARNRVAHMARVGQGLLALLGKGEHALGQVAPLGEIAMLLMGFPGGMHRRLLGFLARSLA